MKKHCFVLFLVLVILFSVFSTSIFATDNSEEVSFLDSGKNLGSQTNALASAFNAIRFVVPEGKELVGIKVRVTDAGATDLILKIYRWDTDYDTTVSKTPVADLKQTAVYDGNQFTLSEALPAGTYLAGYQAKGGFTFFRNTDAVDNLCSYINGGERSDLIFDAAMYIRGRQSVPETGDGLTQLFICFAVITILSVVLFKMKRNLFE